MNRQTVLAIIVVGIIILLTPYYYNWVSPPKEDTARVDSLVTMGENVQTQNQDQPIAVVREPVDTHQAAMYDDVRPWHAPDPEHLAETVEIETPLYTAQFTTLGASVTSWIVSPTKPYLHEPEQLVRIADHNANLSLTARGGLGLLRTREKVFEVDKKQLFLDENDAPQEITFTLPLGPNEYYKEVYTFYPDKYYFDVHIESQGLATLTGAASATYGWGGGLAMTEKDTAQDVFYTEASYLLGNTVEHFKSKGTKHDEEHVTGSATWVAQRTKYFLMALLPKEESVGVQMYTWPDTTYSGKYKPKLYETSLIFNLDRGDINKNLSVYLGPLDQTEVKALDPSLEKTMSWGWKIIQPFSRGVFWVLLFLHGFIPNYGVVLIVFAILIKVIVWPLTIKSHQSMKRMQMLQPKLKALQEKYKDNQQKMQQEVMGLYKEHKVNPMGGCWPVLLQMPLFYGLFIIFRSTIELRGQAFMLWISDLSMPDVLFTLPFTIPLYGDHVCILPLVMAASTFLQSKTTMTDPNQKMMLYMMPVMFIFLFNNFPSGLTLYYTLFNLLSWAQQKFMKVKDPVLEQVVEDAEKEKELEAMRKERRERKKKNRK